MKFTKEIERLEHSAAKLTVTVAKKDVAESYTQTLNKYVKQVQIPGFRKGHVPANVLERKYGEQIKLEAASDLIDNVLNEIFSDEKEIENQKLRNILKNYENSYGITLAKKENEITLLQTELEQLRERLNIPETEKISGSYVQTTFES